MKVAISLPDSIFEAAERAARRMKLSRSRFYAKAVESYVRKNGGAEITGKLNAVYRRSSSRATPALETLSLEVMRRERW